MSFLPAALARCFSQRLIASHHSRSCSLAIYSQLRDFSYTPKLSSTPDLSQLHVLEKVSKAYTHDRHAPLETEEHAKATSNATEEGKTVHPPGAPRKIVRSELYGMKIYLEDGPTDHLQDDGVQGRKASKWVHTMRDVQPQKFVNVDGQVNIIGVPHRPVEDVFWDAHKNERWFKGLVNFRFYPRNRQTIFSNYDYIMKTDYFMFWIPTFLVFSITIPTYCMAYMIDELAYTSMTVKIVGRQWYWVYEVESPQDDGDKDDDE